MSIIKSQPAIILVANSSHFLTNYYLHLINYFKSLSYHVSIIIPKSEYLKVEKFPMDCEIYYTSHFQAYTYNFIRFIRLVKELSKILYRKEILAVLSFTLKMNLAVTLVCNFRKIPFIPTFSGLGFLFSHQKYLTYLSGLTCKFLLKNCNQVLFQNKDDCHLFLKNKWLPKGKIVHIEGAGIDLTYFKPIPFPLLKKKIVLIYLGRIQADKGILCLIDSLKRLKQENIAFTCLLGGSIGSGHPTDISMETLKNWQKQELITYLGNHSDVRPLLRQAHVLIQPSRREGLSRTILEALACGRPVLSSNSPGCKELIQENQNGWLFQADNSEELAQTIQKIIAMSPLNLIKMATGTRKSILPRYLNHSIELSYDLLLKKAITMK